MLSHVAELNLDSINVNGYTLREYDHTTTASKTQLIDQLKDTIHARSAAIITLRREGGAQEVRLRLPLDPDVIQHKTGGGRNQLLDEIFTDQEPALLPLITEQLGATDLSHFSASHSSLSHSKQPWQRRHASHAFVTILHRIARRD
jgi:hypothetical protein